MVWLVLGLEAEEESSWIANIGHFALKFLNAQQQGSCTSVIGSFTPLKIQIDLRGKGATAPLLFMIIFNQK